MLADVDVEETYRKGRIDELGDFDAMGPERLVNAHHVQYRGAYRNVSTESN
jgi:hypothetical protein